MYKGAKTRVKVGIGHSEEFDVGVGVHQGSVLSPFLFSIVLDVLSEDGRKGALYELLYADDLVLMAETIKELEAQFIRWKAAFEGEGLKVNLGKTKVMESSGGGVVFLAKSDPCGVCGKRAKVNYVRCKTYKRGIHAWCARVKRVSRRMNRNFECRVCMNGSNEECKNASNGCLGELERVNSYCYLGDNVNGGGGSELAVTRRIGLGWKAFNSVSSMLCGKRHTWYIKGQIYRTCVRPVMTYGSKTWVVRSVEESILRRAEKRMLRMMCGVQLADGVSTKKLMVRLGLDSTIVKVVRQGSLRWLGHVVRKEDDDCVKQAWRFEVVGSRRRGRPRLTWEGMMENLCRGLGLVLKDGYDRVKWRERFRSWKEVSDPLEKGKMLTIIK